MALVVVVEYGLMTDFFLLRELIRCFNSPGLLKKLGIFRRKIIKLDFCQNRVYQNRFDPNKKIIVILKIFLTE